MRRETDVSMLFAIPEIFSGQMVLELFEHVAFDECVTMCL